MEKKKGEKMKEGADEERADWVGWKVTYASLSRDFALKPASATLASLLSIWDVRARSSELPSGLGPPFPPVRREDEPEPPDELDPLRSLSSSSRM